MLTSDFLYDPLHTVAKAFKKLSNLNVPDFSRKKIITTLNPLEKAPVPSPLLKNAEYINMQIFFISQD